MPRTFSDFAAAAVAVLAAPALLVPVLLLSVMAAPGHAQAFDPSIARARPSVSIAAAAGPLDTARGTRVALWAAPGAAANTEVAWTDGLAAGTIRLDSEAAGCRGFFIVQTSPSGSTPLIGRVCRASGAWQVQQIGPARAAGPSGEPRVRDQVTREPADEEYESRAERPRDVFTEAAKKRDGASGAGFGSATKPMSAGSPSAPMPPPSAPTSAPRREPPPPPAPGNTTGGSSTSGGGIERSTAAVLVEIGAREARKPRNGGSAVVLLSERSDDAARNLRVCRALFRALDTATTGEITTGERRTAEGGIEKLRPVYWLWKGKAAPPAGDACPTRVASYDFTRAASIRTKYGLTGRGPYLVVARSDELRAGVVDLGAAPIGETEDLVRYFRDGFSQETDIWSPERHTPARAQQSLVAFLGRSIPGAALTALVRPVAVASCPLGDFFDVCTPAPR